MRESSISVGHWSDYQRRTGLSVILFDKSVPCGVHLCGSAPATRDIALLDPAMTVSGVDAILLSGGSAYGLGASNGVMNWLNEQGRGLKTPGARVPIVPTACIYDCDCGDFAYPTAENAYQACKSASSILPDCGSMGAGTGAQVGKLMGQAMPGGFGVARMQTDDGLWVISYVVVNSVGDVINQKGEIVAGACDHTQKPLNISQCLQEGRLSKEPFSGALTNTVLVVTASNAALSTNECARLAKMTTAGIAQAIRPAMTPYDGDIIFTASVGEVVAQEIVVGAMMVECTRRAIVNAVAR